jgi:hypothetical protein
MNLDNKAIQMLLKSVIGSLGIDANSLLTNISNFQSWVVNAIKHHDNRLVALESVALANSAKLDRILSLLENNDGRNESHAVEPEHAAIEYFDRDAEPANRDAA